jgi:hypothetical protein
MKKYMRIMVDDVELTAVQLNALIPPTPTVEHPNGADLGVSGNEVNLIPNTPRGRVFTRITNNGASTITITLDATATVTEGSSGSLAVTDPAPTILAGASKVIGPFSANFERTGSKVAITWTRNTVASADIDIETYKIV